MRSLAILLLSSIIGLARAQSCDVCPRLINGSATIQNNANFYISAGKTGYGSTTGVAVTFGNVTTNTWTLYTGSGYYISAQQSGIFDNSANATNQTYNQFVITFSASVPTQFTIYSPTKRSYNGQGWLCFDSTPTRPYLQFCSSAYTWIIGTAPIPTTASPTTPIPTTLTPTTATPTTPAPCAGVVCPELSDYAAPIQNYGNYINSGNNYTASTAPVFIRFGQISTDVWTLSTGSGFYISASTRGVVFVNLTNTLADSSNWFQIKTLDSRQFTIFSHNLSSLGNGWLCLSSNQNSLGLALCNFTYGWTIGNHSVPTTSVPTTVPPTTSAPTTVVPTTLPTTPVQTTPAPTTLVPTTLVPTTQEPTTSAPTTATPTFAPTTTTPTTAAPTTVVPTTAPPTITSSSTFSVSSSSISTTRTSVTTAASAAAHLAVSMSFYVVWVLAIL